MDKYYCNICEYGTYRKTDYTRHLTSKRHEKITKKNGHLTKIFGQKSKKIGKKNDKTEHCEFCNRKYSRKTYLKEHQAKCPSKKIQEVLNEKNDIFNKMIQETNEKNELIEENTILTEEFDMLQDKYNKLLERLADKSIKGESGNTINNINMNYIVNNFTETDNFKDLINEPLTDEETLRILKLGPIDGCAELVNIKCIEDRAVSERPIHLIDAARKKYAIRDNRYWRVDLGGKHMINSCTPRTKEIFDEHNNINEMNSDVRDIFIQELMLLDKKKGHQRIIDAIKNKCLLKNNAIKDKDANL